MSVEVLADAMQNGVSLDRYRELLHGVQQCLRDCGCHSVDRIAMWMAQIGHESAGLRYMEEIASGAAYEGRADLGNTQPGDGTRYKGRGPIQVTGRYNYTECSGWAYHTLRDIVLTPTFFVDDPGEMASDFYGFIGTTWYWTTQRPMNDAADNRDLVQATKYINGGTNGLADRQQRYDHCLRMGDRLLELLAVEPVAPLVLFGEVLLPYDGAIVPQETGYWCGPASAQIVLNTRNIFVDESQLAKECGTHTGGTDSIQLIEKCLDAPGRLPEADYVSVEMPNDPPTAFQKDQFWTHLTNSIDHGFGVVMNWVVPPSNKPRGIKGSPSLNYPDRMVYHYVTAMGYDDNPHQRAVWVADPGFKPFGSWISFDQCCTLMPPKGYIYAANSNALPLQKDRPIMSGDPTYNELLGVEAHHDMTVWAGSPREATASSVQDKVTRMGAEFLRAHRAYDIGRPDVNPEAKEWVGPFDMLSRMLFELTLWLPLLTEAELLQKLGEPETIVGYVRDTASWLQVVNDKLDTLLNRSLPTSGSVDQGFNSDYPTQGAPPAYEYPEYEPPGAAHQPYYPPAADQGAPVRPPFRPGREPVRDARQSWRGARQDYKESR